MSVSRSKLEFDLFTFQEAQYVQTGLLGMDCTLEVLPVLLLYLA